MTSFLEIQEIFERILAKTHNKEDLAKLYTAINFEETLSPLRDIIFINGNSNNIQQGNNNISIAKARDVQLKVENFTYQGRKLETIVEVLHQHIQTYIKKGFDEGFKGLSVSSFQNDYSTDKVISCRHLTGLNEYPVLSFLEPLLPKKLTTILGIEQTPIVYIDNPIIESLKKFREETGNQLLISWKYHPHTGANILYTINNNGTTKKGSSVYIYGRENTETKFDSQITADEFPQTVQDFEEDTLDYNCGSQEFGYSPVYANFQYSHQDSQWTSIIESEFGNGGEIFQYPQLSKVSSYKLASSIFKKPHVKDTWILKVAENNPDIRGFLLFVYKYIKNYNSNYLFGTCDGGVTEITCIPPTPYIRFVDIKNISSQDIKIESITFNVIEKNDYALTIVDNRHNKLLNGRQKHKEINIYLSPQHHIIIPIEFGFDTKEHKKRFAYISSELPQDYIKFSEQSIYINKVPDECSILTDFVKALDSKKISISDLPLTQINPLVTEKIKFHPDLLARIKPLNELFKAVPRRFAIGSFMDVVSLRVDSTDINIDQPNDTPKFSMSVYFAYGSCPYLLVYDSKKGYWKELGTILYGKKHKKLQSCELYNLGDNTTKIRIEEREPEITYIESLSIIYINPQTTTKEEKLISLVGLAEKQKEYFILRQGQSIEIDLQNFIPIDAVEIKLKLNGYYELTEGVLRQIVP